MINRCDLSVLRSKRAPIRFSSLTTAPPPQPHYLRRLHNIFNSKINTRCQLWLRKTWQWSSSTTLPLLYYWQMYSVLYNPCGVKDRYKALLNQWIFHPYTACYPSRIMCMQTWQGGVGGISYPSDNSSIYPHLWKEAILRGGVSAE